MGQQVSYSQNAERKLLVTNITWFRCITFLFRWIYRYVPWA